METNNIPLKSPLKMQIEMQKKKIQIFQNLFVFRAFLEKVVFSNLKPVNIFE